MDEALTYIDKHVSGLNSAADRLSQESASIKAHIKLVLEVCLQVTLLIFAAENPIFPRNISLYPTNTQRDPSIPQTIHTMRYPWPSLMPPSFFQPQAYGVLSLSLPTVVCCRIVCCRIVCCRLPCRPVDFLLVSSRTRQRVIGANTSASLKRLPA